MEQISGYLFVYGTLLDDPNTFGRYVNDHCRFFKKGKFKGRLYDIGEYPGAIFEPGCDSSVMGSILIMNDPAEILKVLDDYEGVGDDCPQPNEYLRGLVDVDTDGNPISCWVYLYNWPVDKARLIDCGDYLLYKMR
jgi:gamma-glutamylcyclotransferase (GGCT)/AIG2-like uncharacterized protein YtfP